MTWVPRTTSLFLFALATLQCTSPRTQDSQQEVVPQQEPRESPAATAERVTPDAMELEARACTEKISQASLQPAVPGAQAFDERRLEILTSAKAEPVVLIETPQFRDAETPQAIVLGMRQLLERTEHPWDALQAMLPKFKARPQLGRSVLLKDGYLYASTPAMAQALVGLVNAEHLFGHDHIWVQRGGVTYGAKRDKGRYLFTDGPSAGEPVRLLLLDRIGHGTPPARALVRDFRALKYQLAFDRATLKHMTETQVVADLTYGADSVRTLLTARGANLELECEVKDAAAAQRLEEHRAQARRRERVVSALRHSMQLQIADQLPFDEPKREWGFQLDGKLRGNWLHAYLTGKSSYAFNGDRYFVFNRQGNVLIPQVCVDFLTDTFERMSGSWWAPKGQAPHRVPGALDYEPMNVLERAKLRRIPGFLAYARANPDKFEVTDIPERERIPLGERRRMAQYLLEHQDDYQPGDIVMIRGKTPWDPTEMHYHSFFIYETDPITGTPIALVGNAGRPTVRYWETEAKRTPRREIWHRLRPKTEWLESIVAESMLVEPLPPPISPRGNAG